MRDAALYAQALQLGHDANVLQHHIVQRLEKGWGSNRVYQSYSCHHLKEILKDLEEDRSLNLPTFIGVVKCFPLAGCFASLPHPVARFPIQIQRIRCPHVEHTSETSSRKQPQMHLWTDLKNGIGDCLADANGLRKVQIGYFPTPASPSTLHDHLFSPHQPPARYHAHAAPFLTSFIQCSKYYQPHRYSHSSSFCLILCRRYPTCDLIIPRPIEQYIYPPPVHIPFRA